MMMMMMKPCTPALVGLALLATPALGSAQSNGAAAEGASDTTARPRISDLPDAPAATMGMKLERTFLKVDVLALTVRVDRGTADLIADAISGAERPRPALEDSVAEIAIGPGEAVADIEFLRTVGLDQFLGGVADDMEKAVEASWVEPGTAAMLRDSLPVWFGFLEEREIRDGDHLSYHIRGDTLRTVFWGEEEAALLLDQTDVGREHVVALLGAYFAPGSSFRERLVASLWKGWDPSNP